MGRSRSRSRSRERHSKKSKSKSRRRSRTRSRDRSRDRRSRSQERYRRSPTPDDKSHSPVKQKEHALDLLERISAGSKKSLDELLLSGDAVVTTTRGDNSKLSLYEQYNVQKINVITIHSKGSKIRSRTEVDEGQGAGEFLSIFINKIIHDINRTQKLPKLGIFDRREIREFVEPTVETKISLRLPSKDELEKLEEKFVSRSKKDKDKGSSSASRSHLDSDRSSKSRDRSASRDGRQNESRDDWRDARLDIGRDDKRDDRREERGVGRVDRDDRNRAQKTVFKVSGIFRDRVPGTRGPVNGNECYFWRTTGCRYSADKCVNVHIPENKGVNYEPWQKAEKSPWGRRWNETARRRERKNSKSDIHADERNSD